MIFAKNLRTEYLYEPMGIDIVNPRFYWNCECNNEKSGKSQDIAHKQVAYQVIVIRNGNIIWDSGKVQSNIMMHIVYGGPQLCSRDFCSWKVKLWDENDEEGDFRESFFEIGLLSHKDWVAKWISGDYEVEADTRYPVDCFSRKFQINGPCERARLYISACGLYEATINGEKVGRDCFTPGCTDYRKRIQYQTYDVKDLLANGKENMLEIELADGWYRGSLNAFGQTSVYGMQTKLICQMEIIYQDGTTQIIGSDKTFLWCNDGPICFADFKDGEIYDANMSPSYQGHAREAGEAVIPTSSNNVPVREKEVFSAKTLRSPTGKTILDFGQNLAGFIDIKMKGERGKKISLRMGEILDENGELTLKNIQTLRPVKNFDISNQIKTMMGNYDDIEEELVSSPLQEVHMTLSGEEDHYRTKYSLFGFRYAEVISDGEIDSDCFHAIAVYSEMESVGEFQCSNEKVNRLFLNTLWSMKSNFLDIPTDCPTRERLGWTGDAQIFFNTAAYFMDTAAFFRKWIADMEDSQYDDGSFPAVIPYAGLEMMYKGTGSSVGWQDAGILIPWRYYNCYLDERILRQSYSMMKKCASFMISNSGPKDSTEETHNPYSKYMYVKGVQLGEWLEPKEFNEPVMAGKLADHPEECTAYMHYSMAIMAKVAALLGKSQDKMLYEEYAEGAKKAYIWMFLREGAPDTDRQAKLVRPLALGLVDDLSDDLFEEILNQDGLEKVSESVDIKRQIQDRLVNAIENYKYCVGTGFLSTPFLLPELTKMGRSDVAYKMLENEELPGWLGEVNAGATTVWENWDGEGSRNHYSPGAVCEWLFSTVGGIRVEGENHFHIEPIIGGNMTYAEASYKSCYGEVEVKWTRGGKMHVCIPTNTYADVVWNGQKIKLKSGSYSL